MIYSALVHADLYRLVGSFLLLQSKLGCILCKLGRDQSVDQVIRTNSDQIESARPYTRLIKSRHRPSTGHRGGPSALFTIQFSYYIFLA
jgi:hypothetical protein